MEPEIVTLDVRPILAQGDEPLGVILAAVDGLSQGQVLRLIAPFRPVPLFRVMARRGYEHSEIRLADKGWQIDFAPAARGLGAGSALDAALRGAVLCPRHGRHGRDDARGRRPDPPIRPALGRLPDGVPAVTSAGRA